MKMAASTGTIVSATSREASSASVTAMAKGRKNSLIKPAMKPSGRKTDTVVSVDDGDSRGDFARAVIRGLAHRLALDGRAGRCFRAPRYYRPPRAHSHREARQAHDVQRDVEDVQQDKGDQDRKGDRDGGHERRAHAAQEEQDHENRQHGARDAFADEAVERVLDEGRTGRRAGHALVPGSLVLQIGQLGGDRVGHRTVLAFWVL